MTEPSRWSDENELNPCQALRGKATHLLAQPKASIAQQLLEGRRRQAIYHPAEANVLQMVTNGLRWMHNLFLWAKTYRIIL